MDKIKILLTKLLYSKVTWWTKYLYIYSIIANIALKKYIICCLNIIFVICFLDELLSFCIKNGIYTGLMLFNRQFRKSEIVNKDE